MQLAIALYNNQVEDEDELEFERGDILTVLIENPHGLDGWWLCQRQGKFGLCPGNRLKLISSRNGSTKDPTKFHHFPSRLSTASMYDAPSTNQDYDNARSSDLVTNPVDEVSRESSTRSSGISSTVDGHHSTSSVDFINRSSPVSTSENELQQLKKAFEKLSIQSNLLNSYSQLINDPIQKSTLRSFLNECQKFLRDYGYLLDRRTYKTIKDDYLNELEQFIDHSQQILNIATRILQYLREILELRSQEKINNNNETHCDVSRPSQKKFIKEISQSATQIHRNPSQTLSSSKTYHSNFVSSSLNEKCYDEISSKNPLISCYYRHIREHIDTIIIRYSSFNSNETRISSIIDEGKSLLLAAHKLLFVLETLHEHLQQTQTLLSFLTKQFSENLTLLIQILKQLVHSKSITNKSHLLTQFKQNIKIMINIVKRIKLRCQIS